MEWNHLNYINETHKKTISYREMVFVYQNNPINAPKRPKTTRIAILINGVAPRLTNAYRPNVNPSGKTQGMI